MSATAVKSVKPTSRFDPAKCRTALQSIDEYDLFSHAESLREIEEKVRASVLSSMKLRVRSAKTERLLSEQITLWIRTTIEAFCKDGFAVRFSSALLADMASLGFRVSKEDILDEFFEREKDAVLPMLASCGAFLTSYRCANGSIFRESPLIWFTQDEIMDSWVRLGFFADETLSGKFFERVPVPQAELDELTKASGDLALLMREVYRTPEAASGRIPDEFWNPVREAARTVIEWFDWLQFRRDTAARDALRAEVPVLARALSAAGMM